MNSYYSSEEEIAWGPVTLREIKSDLKRMRKPDSRRHTIHPCPKAESTILPKITLEAPTFCQEMEGKCNISSTCDEYYSPNESVISSFKDKDDFAQESSVYLTASETKTTSDSRSSSRVSSAPQCHNDSHVNFVNAAMNRNTYCDLQNFHQTLIEPTMLTPEKSFSHSICPNNSTGSTESQEEVIVISSDEDEEERVESGTNIKNEKYSYFVNVSTESEEFPEKNCSLREIEECSLYKRERLSNGNLHNSTFESDISSENGNFSYQSKSSGKVDGNNCESSDEVESAFTFKKHETSLNKSVTSDSESDDVLCIDEDAEASFVEENEIDTKIEPSIHEADESFQEVCEDRDKLSNGGSNEGNPHNSTFESNISSEKENSPYQSTSSGKIDGNNGESSDEVESAFNFKKHETSLNKSSTSDSDSNSDDVLCIDEDAEASFVEEKEIEREQSIHKADESLQEVCKDSKVANMSNGRRSRKSFVDECNGSLSDDNAEPVDSLRGSRTYAVEKEMSSKYNDSLEIDEKQHGMREYHNLSRITIPNIDLSQFDDTYDGLSQLNDSLEMFEKLLSQGLDTSYYDSESSERNSDKPSGNNENDDVISASFLQKPTTSLLNTEKRVSPLKNRVDNIKPKNITPNRRFEAATFLKAVTPLKSATSLKSATLSKDATPFKIATPLKAPTPLKAATPLKSTTPLTTATPLNSAMPLNSASPLNSATPLKAKQLGIATPGKSCKSHIPKLRKSPSGDNFKMPMTPVWPKTCSGFQNIVSPVRTYIRYSPKPVFRQNVESGKMGKVTVNQPMGQHKNKENKDSLPAVIYNPGRRQVVTADKKQALPPSLAKMIKESDLTKHNRKGIQYKSATKVQKKLDEGIDLTRSMISDSLLEDPSQDVSILHKRDRPFLK